MVILFADGDLMKMGAEAALDVIRVDSILDLIVQVMMMIMHQLQLPG
jgi:hypothetical protein